jgi:hypothetical protein
MNKNIETCKKLRKHCLIKYSVAHLPFKQSRVELHLESIDEVLAEEWNKAARRPVKSEKI